VTPSRGWGALYGFLWVAVSVQQVTAIGEVMQNPRGHVCRAGSTGCASVSPFARVGGEGVVFGFFFLIRTCRAGQSRPRLLGLHRKRPARWPPAPCPSGLRHPIGHAGSRVPTGVPRALP
jgi:hypothetical protein